MGHNNFKGYYYCECPRLVMQMFELIKSDSNALNMYFVSHRQLNKCSNIMFCAVISIRLKFQQVLQVRFSGLRV